MLLMQNRSGLFHRGVGTATGSLKGRSSKSVRIVANLNQQFGEITGRVLLSGDVHLDLEGVREACKT